MTDEPVQIGDALPEGWRSSWKKPEETRKAKSIRAKKLRKDASAEILMEGELIPPKRPPRNQYNRTYEFTDEIKAEIIERIASGQTLKRILSEDRMPSYMTVYRAEHDDEEFGRDMALARQVQAAVLADEVLEISDDSAQDVDKNGRVDFEVIARSKIRTDNRKWLISKLDPKKWGEKVQTDITSGGEKLDTKEISPLESARQVAFALELARRNQPTE